MHARLPRYLGLFAAEEDAAAAYDAAALPLGRTPNFPPPGWVRVGRKLPVAAAAPSLGAGDDDGGTGVCGGGSGGGSGGGKRGRHRGGPSSGRAATGRPPRATLPPQGPSRFRGVHWSRRHQRWVANICVKGAKTCIGYFKDEEAAARSYDAAAAPAGKSVNFPAVELGQAQARKKPRTPSAAAKAASMGTAPGSVGLEGELGLTAAAAAAAGAEVAVVAVPRHGYPDAGTDAEHATAADYGTSAAAAALALQGPLHGWSATDEAAAAASAAARLSAAALPVFPGGAPGVSDGLAAALHPPLTPSSAHAATTEGMLPEDGGTLHLEPQQPSATASV